MSDTRALWTEAKRRLIERYMKEHPDADWAQAANVISDRHEAIGAMMDAMTGKRTRA